ncbi:MAG TPA: type VI secretion system baseplate subunit TssE [Bryobacteraceae bacterium]|jgi:type VI secretion system protein ImpF|nr:type VI secretion system baseplate subunit TssE [Bryobacteraceae bacterium]
MARSRSDAPVVLSVLDRLVDEDPRRSEEAPLSRAQSVREMKAAVRRDLEWLLNTRQPLEAAPEGSQLERSLFSYGLPDVTSMSISSLKDRQRLTEAIEQALVKFEPRIANVRVTLLSTGAENIPVLRFLIEGLLRLDPSPEPVRFDTLLDMASKEYKVQGETSAR